MSDTPQTIDAVTLDLNEPIIDEDQIEMLKMVDEDDGSGSLLQELFDLFSAESSQRMEALTEICERNDTAELRKLIHFVSGSAGNVGLLRLNHCYRSIEEAIDHEKLTDLTGAAAPIRAVYDESCQYMRDTQL